MEGGEGGKQDVELPFALEVRDSAWHMCVAEGQVRRVNVEVRQRAAARGDGTRQRTLPVGGKRLAIQGAQQIEVHRIRLKLHVVHGEHRAPGFERHRPPEPRPGRPHIHVADDIVELVQLPLVHDVELHLAAARGRQSRIHPRDVGQ